MLKKNSKLNHSIIQYVSYFLLTLLILFLVFAPVAWFYNNHVKAKSILMDAKNIQLSMRLLNIQYYGENVNIFQPGTKNGMAEDTMEEIKCPSDTDGDITLIYWDYEDNVPGKFYYKTEDFMAIYEYDTIRKEPCWEILRLKEIIEFGKD